MSQRRRRGIVQVFGVLSAALAGLVLGYATPVGALPSDQCELVCTFEVSCNDPCHHGWEDTTCGADGRQCREILEHDGDGDGVPDIVDNCPFTWNADQADCDNDGQGNACDDPCTCQPDWEITDQVSLGRWGIDRGNFCEVREKIKQHSVDRACGNPPRDTCEDFFVDAPDTCAGFSTEPPRCF